MDGNGGWQSQACPPICTVLEVLGGAGAARAKDTAAIDAPPGSCELMRLNKASPGKEIKDPLLGHGSRRIRGDHKTRRWVQLEARALSLYYKSGRTNGAPIWAGAVDVVW